jgi:hypothetical protein
LGGFTPFELDIGMNARLPLDLAAKVSQSGKQGSWQEFLANWQKNCAEAQRHVHAAQERQRKYANQSRREDRFEVGDQVLIRVDRGPSAAIGTTTKLGPRKEGPFTVTEVMGDVNVRLRLDDSDQRHDVFHISQLRRWQQRDQDRFPKEQLVEPESCDDQIVKDRSGPDGEQVVDEGAIEHRSELDNSSLQPRRSSRQFKVLDRGPFIY